MTLSLLNTSSLALLCLSSVTLLTPDAAAGAANPDAERAPTNTSAQVPVQEFQITAERFQFSPSTIEVNQGDTVRLVVRSVDVAHGFRIDGHDVEMLIPGGGSVTVEFVATRAGSYQFRCTNYCGLGHDGMLGSLNVRGTTTGVQIVATGPDELDDRRVDPAEPDFTLVTLPTTLRLPNHTFAFRLTHRFSRPLGQGNFGDLVEDLFGFDTAALIGLEFRYGLFPGTQLGISRGNTRTIQFFGRHSFRRQGDAGVIGLDAVVFIEGLDNFTEEYSPGVGVVISKQIKEHAAFYVEPTWVGNTNNPGRLHVLAGAVSNDDNTFMIGLGARLRIRPTVYLVGEFIPRVAGFDLGDDHVTFGVEKRVGGHSFQVNFSNSLGSTLGQIAQGASDDDWFIGFNITRKFY